MDGDGSYDDLGDPSGNVPFSMDYALALKRARSSLTALELDVLSALVAAPNNELRAGQVEKLLGLSHHATANSAIVGLAKKLTRAVGVEAPKRPNGTTRWWHAIADGRHPADHTRYFFWKLRPALRDAAINLGICAIDDGPFPDAMARDEAALVEGASKMIRVNAYERNAVARRRCIEHHGTTCVVCGFSFGEVYGAIAAGVIHVHHLRPLADCGGEDYCVDPVEDLRPVCPTAMSCCTVANRHSASRNCRPSSSSDARYELSLEEPASLRARHVDSSNHFLRHRSNERHLFLAPLEWQQPPSLSGSFRTALTRSD